MDLYYFSFCFGPHKILHMEPCRAAHRALMLLNFYEHM